MHCIACGKEINNAQYCPFCGKQNQYHQPAPTEQSVTARLIEQSLSGDKQASSDLISYVYQDMYNIALAISHNAADASDAVQNACIKILSNLANLQNPDSFRPWCKTIVRTETIDLLNKNYRKNDIFFTDLENQEDGLMYDPEDERIGYRPDLQLDNDTRREIIMNIMGQLSEDQRIVAMMYFYDQMKMKDIAAELGIPESTVVGRLQRAKSAIKTSVSDLQARDDIKLYNMSPLPFFIYLLSTWKFAAVQTGQQVLNQSAARLFGTAISGAATGIAGYTAGTAFTAAGSTAASSYGAAGTSYLQNTAATISRGAGTSYINTGSNAITNVAGSAAGHPGTYSTGFQSVGSAVSQNGSAVSASGTAFNQATSAYTTTAAQNIGTAAAQNSITYASESAASQVVNTSSSASTAVQSSVLTGTHLAQQATAGASAAAIGTATAGSVAAGAGKSAGTSGN